MYNHQVFNSTEAFLDAYHDGTLKRLPHRPDQDPSQGEWSTRKRPTLTAQRDLDNLPGPRSVSFGGLRFRVDRALQYVSWMGWGMYLGFDKDMGLSLWDLRFRGDRIIYEVSLPRMHGCVSAKFTCRGSLPLKKPSRSMVSIFVVHISDCVAYADATPAGNDPMQTTTAWLDRFFGMVRRSAHLT